MPQLRLPVVFDLQRTPSVGKRRSKRAKSAPRQTQFEMARARQPKPAREMPWRRVFGSMVAMTVLGAVMLMLYSLSRIARYAGETINVEPMDYDPSDRVSQARKEE